MNSNSYSITMFFLFPVIKIIIPNVIYIQCTKRILSVFIFNGNIHSSNPLPMVGIELFTHTHTHKIVFNVILTKTKKLFHYNVFYSQ